MNSGQKIAVPLLVFGVLIVITAIAVFLRNMESNDDAQRATLTPASVPVEPPVEPLPPKDEILRLLKAEAKKQGVYWKVWCTAFYEGDEKKFSGIATKGELFNIYIEEGATDYWSVHNFKTPEGAAFALLQALKGPPTQKPQHKKRMRAECSSETFEGTPESETNHTRP